MGTKSCLIDSGIEATQCGLQARGEQSSFLLTRKLSNPKIKLGIMAVLQGAIGKSFLPAMSWDG